MSSMYMPSHPATDFIYRRTAPRGPERSEIETGEICYEIDVHQEATYKRRWFDIFDQKWHTGDETILSGNGPLYWSGGGPEHLNSRFDMHRAGPGMPRDTCDMFLALGALPGVGTLFAPRETPRPDYRLVRAGGTRRIVGETAEASLNCILRSTSTRRVSSGAARGGRVQLPK